MRMYQFMTDEAGRLLDLVERLDALLVEREGGIVPDGLRMGRGRGDDGAGAERQRERDQCEVKPKRTGNVTHTGTASFPRRAGSKRHVFTASTAARSRSM